MADLTGQRFGRLVAVRIGEPLVGASRTRRRWLCRCDCGVELHVQSFRLRAGSTRSCGCLRRETSRALLIKHGGSADREHSSWRNMHARCTDQKHQGFKNYGGKGVRVCERWNDYPTFLADMGRAGPGMSIDRINNDGNYEPGNCRWATATEQARNSKTAKLTMEKAQEIRFLRASQNASRKQLSAQFGVTAETIDSVLKGRTWKEVGQGNGG